MNDDIEILTPDWIERLLEHFEKPHVGRGRRQAPLSQRTDAARGCRAQLFGTRITCSRRFPRTDAGYFFSTCGVRNYCAGDRRLHDDARRESIETSEATAMSWPVSFNDVDFCMKVRRKGLSVVYTPSAELISHGVAVSRCFRWT